MNLQKQKQVIEQFKETQEMEFSLGCDVMKMAYDV